MKVTVTLEEALVIVARYVVEKHGVPIKKDSGVVVSHIEGQYDESEKVVDGFSFEIIGG